MWSPLAGRQSRYDDERRPVERAIGAGRDNAVRDKRHATEVAILPRRLEVEQRRAELSELQRAEVVEPVRERAR